MIPGVVSVTPSHAQQLPLPLDSLVCVIPYKGTSRVPVAVGRMAVPSSEISEDAKGKAVVTLHAYRDALWERGSKSDPPEQVDVIGEDKPTDLQHTEEDTPHMENTGVPEPGSSEPPGESPVPELAPQEVDALLRQSLLYYIRVTLASTPSLLPLPTSTLYSDGILPSRPFTHPALNQINIKSSSYKKLKPFLKAVEKDGILKLKEMGGDLVVVSVDTAHLDVVGVGKWRTVGEEDRKQKAREEREAESSGKSGLLGVRELCKPIGGVVALFEAVGLKYVQDPHFRHLGSSVINGHPQTYGTLYSSSNPRRHPHTVHYYEQSCPPYREEVYRPRRGAQNGDFNEEGTRCSAPREG